jgi:hypothetical protein
MGGLTAGDQHASSEYFFPNVLSGPFLEFITGGRGTGPVSYLA